MPPLLRYTQHLARKYVVGSAPVIGGDTERNMTNTVISGLAESYPPPSATRDDLGR